MSNEPKHNLAKLIGIDIITVGRVPLMVLLLIFASAMGVVFATHHTRQAINQKDVALQERERLDNEWRNLLLEENALSEHSRVQAMAKQELDMKRPDADKEVVVSLK
ncbi:MULTISPECIES: cell division protein FtsL [Vibrio]|jgi:cell division protein FtsL|uniref:Cell division protein FtsL n=1 Tax=Vibrio mediterranei TaxID=689 RepID=A0A2C9P8G3_9VIBR|nr:MULTISPECIES: cell division protein FtsL [Vibrio]ASI89002.1 cell division protein FtsL [Vibrio mediterranei]AYV20958.1 cell division protein FtsL [Vibrio mediterranei]EDL53010.1 cell division protein FtsL [Vibrio mediterranei AK1]KFA99931.1 cell division protein FtsL [Vibrio sp. ER1A]MCF4174022.1 cell division protein FtsL [Vibrio sp. McD22-P3]